MRTTRRILLTVLPGTVVLTALATGCAPVGPSPRPAPAVGSPVAAVPAPAEVPVVVLDPGHNGGNSQDPGAVNRQVPDGRGGTKPCNTTGTATNAGYPEHAFTFDVATRVAKRLDAAGVRVVLTRPDDEGVGPCVDQRGHAGETHDANAVVSIHGDGSAGRNSGFHVAYADPPLNPAQEGPAVRLATALRDAMLDGRFRSSDYIGHDGLSARSDLAGLNLANRPTALVECANMRNATEAALVSSPEGRDRYATAIAAGVLAFLGRPG